MSRARDLANVADDVSTGTVVTTASPSLGRRNLIINGAMQVAQRGTSFTAAGYTLDRMRAYLMQSGGATYTQSTDAPSGFKNSLKVEVTTAVTSPNSTDYSMMRQLIEAQNCIPQLSWGTSDADSITISFWVKSSITGDFGIALHNENFNYSYADLYTINAVDTWEYKTVTITGATAGAWNTGNDIGIVVNFSHGSGSGRQITTGSWTGSGALGASGETNLYATVGNTWQITGVQLEVGSVATPFEHRSFGEELALCQRYFYDPDGAYADASAANEWVQFNLGQPGTNSNEYIVPVTFPVTMRAVPTVTVGSNDYGVGVFTTLNANGNGRLDATTSGTRNIGKDGCSLKCRDSTDTGHSGFRGWFYAEAEL